MTPTIRQVRPEEATQIRLIAEAAYAPYIPAIGRPPAPMVADFPGQIAQGIVWGIARDRLEGFIVFFPRADHMFLENVATHPEARGHGLGRMLIEHCEAEARAQGLPAVELYTNEKMTANLGFYSRLGYRETDRRLQDGFNRIFFRKALS